MLTTLKNALKVKEIRQRVIFTFLIRALVFPLDYKSRVGMRKMQKLQPKQAELQKKYRW